jgi:predicted choloylglycine hydrolase
VSLTFGGRQVLGDGFGIPIVVRYLLETCTTAFEAREKLARLPYSLTHNLTIVDATGEVLTAYLSPDRDPVFRAFPAATNHQGVVEWPEQAMATRTIERERRVLELLEDPDATPASFADAFLESPLYSAAYQSGFGTLYTAVYRPLDGLLTLRWPTHAWPLALGSFVEDVHTEVLVEGSVA